MVGNVAGTVNFTDPANINVYDPNTRAYLGQLTQPNGSPIAIYGLWDMEFGDGTPKGGKANWLYFDAGPNHPNDDSSGLFGVIKPAGDEGNHHGRHEHGSLVSASVVSPPTMPPPILPSSMMLTSTPSGHDGTAVASGPVAASQNESVDWLDGAFAIYSYLAAEDGLHRERPEG